MAASNPIRLSVQAMKMSSTPRFSGCSVQLPRTWHFHFLRPTCQVRPCGRSDQCQWRCTPPSSRSVLHCGHGSGWHPIIHTDRGCHYRWPGWIDRLEHAALTLSISERDVPLINQRVETSLAG